MKEHNFVDIKDHIWDVLLSAATGNEFAKIEVDTGLYAVVISESEWNIMCEAFALLVGAQKTRGRS